MFWSQTLWVLAPRACNTKAVSWVNEVKNRFARTGPGKPLTAYFIGTQEHKQLKLSPHLAVARRKSLLQLSHVAQSPHRLSPPCPQPVSPWQKLHPHHDGHLSCCLTCPPCRRGWRQPSGNQCLPSSSQGGIGMCWSVAPSHCPGTNIWGWRSQLCQWKSRVQRKRKT